MQGLQAENERLRTLVDSLKAESEAQVSNLASLYVAVSPACTARWIDPACSRRCRRSSPI